jgi:thiamine monophosphate synthase
VKAAGADAIAVVSAALGEQDVKRAVQQLIAEMNVPGSECRDS